MRSQIEAEILENFGTRLVEEEGLPSEMVTKLKEIVDADTVPDPNDVLSIIRKHAGDQAG